jgi:hypothetical protein
MDKVLNMLVIFINDGIRYCKSALETEEKSKIIAFLQGKIIGYRMLLSLLKEHFLLAPSFIEDNGEIPIKIEGLSDNEINDLTLIIEGLQVSDAWGKIIENIVTKEKELESFLLHEAENTRDLFLSQAQYMAMSCYNNLFISIKTEKERREQELPFDSEDNPE